MTTKLIDGAIGEVEDLITVWTANSSFSMGDITLPMLKEELAALRTLRAQTEETRLLLSRQSDETNDKMDHISSIVVRGRSGIRATFGPDSPQYAQVGGTRESERKPRSSKKKAGGTGSSQ